eukprot:CAMPEP_0113545932 /NCGR_PEP_ID=MMETSP0015_2-20120614/11533_1 /TAXON_ID=2838 /ORGANISM="Odontella" /LENGTH=194 /DNA_ID=CAMNT_0000446347 /DNA_START=85 /DNA_END=666 /DNA_ORIENTATION=- /assembly_acc=CAM_ASM_000160
MSLESKLENLSLGDEPSVVEALKADGAEKSGFAAGIGSLVAKAASKDEAEAVAALKTAQAVAEGAVEGEAFNKQVLSSCLEQATHKSPNVRNAAKATALAICKNITPFAMKSLLPIIFAELPVEKKWQIRVMALECLSVFKDIAPRQLGNALPLVVPEVTACMWDTKKQVKTAATAAMRGACEVIGNKDIEHMT